MLNRLSFKEYKYIINEGSDEIPFTHVEILIDDIPLKQHLKQYELSIAKGQEEKDLAGNYEAVDSQIQFKKLLFKHQSYLKSTRVFPYQCAIDLTDDWKISFDVKIRLPYVYFDNFHLEISHINKHEVFPYSLNSKEKIFNHKPVNWKYDNFKGFKFSYIQYISAVKNLGLSKDWKPV